MILVSSDEKKYVQDEFLKFIKKSNVLFEHIEIGDIVVGNYIIERKQINDLYSSVLDGRLFMQLETMKAFMEENQGVNCILIVEGYKLKKNLEKYSEIFNLNEILVNVILEYGIIPYKTNSIEDTVKFIKELGSYNNKNKKLISSVRGFKRKKSLSDRKIFALMGFPTIGEKRAKKIIKDYTNLIEYFNSVLKEDKNNQVRQVLEG